MLLIAARLRILLLHVSLELGLLVDVVLRDAVEGRTTGSACETEGHERRLVVDVVFSPDGLVFRPAAERDGAAFGVCV